MARISSLILLIHSLTKAEKRHFKLSTTGNEKESDYSLLFRIIESGSPAEAALIREKFEACRPAASYEVTSKYLFKVLTDCLLELRHEQDKTYQLYNQVFKAKILFEKSLYDEGFRLLKSTYDKAQQQKKFLLQAFILQTEQEYHANLNFQFITEDELVKDHQKIQEALKHQSTANLHTSLFHTLKHRLIYKGNIRTTQQQEQLNDLLLSELHVVAKSQYDSFSARKHHLLFQATYYLITGVLKASLQTFKELNELFEENPDYWKNKPITYLTILEGILDSLHSIRHYDEMLYYIHKIEQLQTITSYEDVAAKRMVFLYRLIIHLNRGEFKKAQELHISQETFLFSRIHLLGPYKEAEVYLYTSLIYLCKGDYNKAQDHLNRILLSNSMYSTLPLYRTFRLIRVLLHLELKNFEYLKYEIRSIRRELRNNKDAFLVEKVVLRFIEEYPLPGSPAKREAIWEQYSQEFSKIGQKRYEMQTLKIFDFAAWIAAKLTRQPLAELMYSHPCINDTAQSQQEKQKHGGNQPAGSFGSIFKFTPNENTP